MEFINPPKRRDEAKDRKAVRELLKEKNVISDAEILAKRTKKVKKVSKK